MPFDDLSPDDNDWLAKGIAQELIDSLARIDGLYVASRRSTNELAGQNASVADIGNRLNVGTFVDGSVRLIDDQINVVAHWTSIEDGRRLWSANYNRPFEDILAIQKEVAVGIAEAIRNELGIRDTSTYLFKQRYQAADVRAWALVRQAAPLIEAQESGVNEGHQEREAMVARGRSYLQQAIDLDPDYAEPYAQMAASYEDMRRRVQFARRALEIDPTNATALEMLIWDSAMGNWDYQTAGSLLDYALTKNPVANNLVEIAHYVYFNAGRFADALEAAQRARRLDPLWARAHCTVGWSHYHGGEQELAIEPFEVALEIVRETKQGYVWCGAELADAYKRQDRLSEAKSVMISRYPMFADRMEQGFESGGWIGLWKALAEAWEPPMDQVSRCHFWAFAENYERMYACFDAKMALTDPSIPVENLIDTIDRHLLAQFLSGHGAFDKVRAEPRFQALVAQLRARIEQARGTSPHAALLRELSGN